MEKVYIYDTTLRDGSQSEGVNFSLEDKLLITKHLDDFGIDYIEAGWPGSNPKDTFYFEKIKHVSLKHAKIVAFGSTRKKDSNSLFRSSSVIAFKSSNTSYYHIW